MSKLVDFSGFGLRHAEDSLIEKIVNFASKPDCEDDLDKASRIYWQAHNSADVSLWENPDSPLWLEEGNSDKVDALAARFHDWYLFDYRLGSGLRMVEFFARECSGTLNRYELQLLSQWVESYFGVFMVEGQSGCNLDLRDVLDGRKFRIFGEPDDSYSEGDLITGRPLSLGESSRMSGSVMTVRANYSEAVITGLRSRYSRLLTISPSLTVPQFYRLCGHLLDSLIGRVIS